MTSRQLLIIALVILAVGVAFTLIHWGTGMWPVALVGVIVAFLILLALKP